MSQITLANDMACMPHLPVNNASCQLCHTVTLCLIRGAKRRVPPRGQRSCGTQVIPKAPTTCTTTRSVSILVSYYVSRKQLVCCFITFQVHSSWMHFQEVGRPGIIWFGKCLITGRQITPTLTFKQCYLIIISLFD